MTAPKFKLSALLGALNYLRRPEDREVEIEVDEDRIKFTVESDGEPFTMDVARIGL